MEENRIYFVDEEVPLGDARIKVIGIGGAGGNAVNNMILAHNNGVEFITANTDLQALNATLAPTKLRNHSGRPTAGTSVSLWAAN